MIPDKYDNSTFDVLDNISASDDKERHVLGHALSAWYVGNWHNLIELDVTNVLDPTTKGKLCLLIASAFQQIGDMVLAKRNYEISQSFGCSKSLIGKMMLSGLYNQLGLYKLHTTNNSPDVLPYFIKSIEVVFPHLDAKIFGNLRFQQQAFDSMERAEYVEVLSNIYSSFRGVQISDIPHIDEFGLQFFEDCLKNLKGGYLEYGSGASTLFAFEKGVEVVVSVASDKSWMSAVEKRIFSTYGVEVDFYPICVDIGKTNAWGYPVDKTKMDEYHRYSSAPWDLIVENNLDIGLILIDGRFRVACFVYSLMNAKSGTRILFDDYVDREHYHVVEDLVNINAIYGRMAEFIIPDNFDKFKAYKVLSEHLLTIF
ncbi:MAG: hypothetical protein PHC75_06595 [Burkholderiales bacterium]|nr:hypothetical protein [Burkholderiales bacterium]